MDFPSRLNAQLDALSVTLEASGDDLQAILSVLIDDLTAAVPSFVGLTVTVHADGEPVTIHVSNPHPATTSMMLPMASTSGQPTGNHIVFYARDPGV